MGGGSWNGGGDIPAHPSAWCKVQQGWATVTNVTSRAARSSLPDVKTSRNVHRLWKDGAGGPEYFLLENRQRTGYDAELPGDGLLIWHIDDNQPGNTDENHYKVGLVQADGERDLERQRADRRRRREIPIRLRRRRPHSPPASTPSALRSWERRSR